MIAREMKGYRPHSYVVTVDPHVAQLHAQEGRDPDINPRGSHFLVRLKEHLVVENQMVPDQRFDGLLAIYGRSCPPTQKYHPWI